MNLKLRPILDCRMPTLATKTAFLLPALDDMSRLHRRSMGVQQLETNPPRSLAKLRHSISSEIKGLSKKLSRLERNYYGVGKSLQHEVEKSILRLKGVLRMLNISEFSSKASLEKAIKDGSDSEKYKGDPNNIALIKELYGKIQTFMPSKFSDLIETCTHIKTLLEKYCVSFYDSETDHYLETAAHYQQQIEIWIETVSKSITNIKKLQKNYQDIMIHHTQFTSPVLAFCQKNECENVPVVLLFADGCTNIKAVMSVANNWIQADQNYPVFLRNDIDDLDRQREEKVRLLRDAKTKYHTLTYKLSQSEIEFDKALTEMETWKNKQESMKDEADNLRTLSIELQTELEFKEYRKKELRKRESEYSQETYIETYEMLTDEIHYAKDKMPPLKRQLAAVQYKLEWMTQKENQVKRMGKDIKDMKKELVDIRVDRERKEEEFEQLEKALDLARRIHRYKTSTDVTEKIFFSLPIGQKKGKELKYKLAKACETISEYIDQDWMLLYRQLPFYPKRGSHTIEKDISDINIDGARGPLENKAVAALKRWRRHHTRAKKADLVDALKKIRRHDVLSHIENSEMEEK